MLDTAARRIGLAIIISLLLHGLLLWGPNIELPHFKSSLPPLLARLEALPNAPATPKPKRKIRSAPKPGTEAAPQGTPVEDIPLAASAVAAASTTPAAETLAQPEPDKVVERPPLPRRAHLLFAANKGTSDFKIGEVMNTLEIDDGRYVLQSVSETVGLAKLFKSYKLTQYSSGSYSRQGLQPEQFFEERADGLGTQRSTVELNHAAQRAYFSHGGEAPLPPDTQDILSILYQFPPLEHAEAVIASVSNGRKIERYEFVGRRQRNNPYGDGRIAHRSSAQAASAQRRRAGSLARTGISPVPGKDAYHRKKWRNIRRDRHHRYTRGI